MSVINTRHMKVVMPEPMTSPFTLRDAAEGAQAVNAYQLMQWLLSDSRTWQLAWCSNWSSSQIQLSHEAHCRHNTISAKAWQGCGGVNAEKDAIILRYR